MRLLNENSRFQCTGNISIQITASEQGNAVARDSRRKILTEGAQCVVKIPSVCSILTTMANGTPTNCRLSHQGWINTCSTMKCNGKRVLTEQSFTVCQACGVKIQPCLTTCTTKIGAAVSVSDISDEVSEGKNVTAGTMAEEDEGKEEAADTAQESDYRAECIIGVECALDFGKEKSGEASPSADADKKKPAYASHMLCDYENCGEWETCGYYNSKIFVENNSLKLSANFQSERKSDWNAYLLLHQKRNAESENGGWRIAAHHLISGNQVLMMKDDKGDVLYGELVKLANYFGYDINNAWNCIMLPTYESNFGQLEPIQKTAGAYDVMGLMGRQWHAGGHEYTLGKDTLKRLSEYYGKHPEQYPSAGNPDFFANYITAMKEEMDKLLMRYSRNQCWKKNYKKKREKFIRDMGGLSAKVEKYLLDFGENPRKSFPFFVSKVSVEYAYDLPSTSKLVAVYGAGNKIRAKRIRLERYLRNELKIFPVEKDDMEIGEAGPFILFCENVMHFLIDSNLEGFSLPFVPDPVSSPTVRMVDFHGEGVMSYVAGHGNELLAFINKNEYPYQPAAKIVRLRGGS